MHPFLLWLNYTIIIPLLSTAMPESILKYIRTASRLRLAEICIVICFIFRQSTIHFRGQ